MLHEERKGLRLMSRKKTPKKAGAEMRSKEDYLGSYTGVCAENEYERPVQDADDL